MEQSFRKNGLLIFFSLFFAFTVAWNIYLYTLPNHLQTANYLFNGLYGTPSLIIGLVILLNIKKRQSGGELVSSLSYLALGSIIFAIALYIWVYYNLVLKIPVPHPSVDEAFFAVYPFLLTIGTVRLLRFYTGMLNWKVLVEAIVVFLLITVPLYYYFILPSMDPDGILIGKFIVFAILIGNALLFTVVYLIVRIGGGQIRWLLFLYGASYLLIIAGQFLFQYRTDVGSYWNGDISDLLIAIHVYLFCLATVYAMNTAFNAVRTVGVAPPLSDNTTHP